MKKALVFCLMGLIISSSAVLAAPKQQDISKKLEFRPKPFLNVPFTYFWHNKDGFGANALGIDVALLKCGSFYFLDFGIGLGMFCREEMRLIKNGYYSLEFSDGQLMLVFNLTSIENVKYKDPYPSFYFKFSPVKIPLNITKNMRDTAFFEIGIFSQKLKRIDGFVIGMSFSFDVFKNKKKKGDKK